MSNNQTSLVHIADKMKDLMDSQHLLIFMGCLMDRYIYMYISLVY